MIPLSLYIALIGAVAPAVAQPPVSIEESCDATKLAAMVSAPRKQWSNLQQDLDRRIQNTLFEERRQEAISADLAAASKAHGDSMRTTALMLALAVLGVGLGFAAVQRRSLATMALALGVIVAAGGIGYRQLEAQRGLEAQRREVLAESSRLAACHLRLTETRATLEHSLLAFAVWRLDEFDEDVMSWRSKLKQDKQPVTIEQLNHMHDEIVDAIR